MEVSIREDDTSWAGGMFTGYTFYAFMVGDMYQYALPQAAEASARKAATVFIFARLDGLVGKPEFASTSKITGGFGYKGSMTLPYVDKQLGVLGRTLNPVPFTWFSLSEGQTLAMGLGCTASKSSISRRIMGHRRPQAGCI
ncbi:hypothetical protein F66182_15189 [Fusarium sp. NRRL 66182]|nr:hypothetical protein F66182_15189 [Fusarium sp. NRRL 66182]